MSDEYSGDFESADTGPSEASASETPPASSGYPPQLAAMWDRLGQSNDGRQEPAPMLHRSAAPPAAAEQQVDQYGRAPQSWKREIADSHWQTLAPELRGYLHQRESEAHRALSEHGTRLKEAAEYSQQFAGLHGVLDRYGEYLPEGASREDAVEQLFAAHRMLQQDPRTALTMLMQQSGIDPIALLPEGAQREIAQLRQRAQRAEVAQLRIEIEQLEAFHKDFTKDKPHYPRISAQVSAEIAELRKGAPGLDHQTVFKLAYDRVMERSGLGAQLEMDRSRELQRKQDNVRGEHAAKARRAASLNVRSAPASRTNPKTADDTIRELAYQLYS